MGPSWKRLAALSSGPLSLKSKDYGGGLTSIWGADQVGEEWLERTAEQLRTLGFDPYVERTEELIPPETLFEVPAFYFGWWKAHPEGAIAAPRFRFPPGAIAIHIHSFSAITVRASDKAWLGPLVAKGATATVGNVYEPFLEYTHHPHLFLEALAKGWTLGESAFYSLPVLSWQAVLIGDPLYRPLLFFTCGVGSLKSYNYT